MSKNMSELHFIITEDTMPNIYEECKPKLRGILHGCGFLLTSVFMLFYTFSSLIYGFNWGIMIFLFFQMIQFAVSAIYHIPDWDPRTKSFLQCVDHIFILLLISGIHTSIVVNNISNRSFDIGYSVISLTWFLSILGILKIAFLKRIYYGYDQLYYFINALAIFPFIFISDSFDISKSFFLFLGITFYVIGGMIFSLEIPNPYPKYFGYHEVFHFFTIVASICLLIVISKGYFGPIVDYEHL